jgi:hypothetical protein
MLQLCIIDNIFFLYVSQVLNWLHLQPVETGRNWFSNMTEKYHNQTCALPDLARPATVVWLQPFGVSLVAGFFWVCNWTLDHYP